MKAVVVGCLLFLMASASALAADVGWGGPRRHTDRATMLPIAPNSLSATVLASDGCWRACEAQCGKRVRKCVGTVGLSGCLPFNDACGRVCVNHCRAYGGPLLNWTD